MFGNLRNMRIYLSRRKLVDPLIDEHCLLIEFQTDVMKDFEGLFLEMKLKVKLPDYSTNNFNSLSECLSDLEWLPSDGYILYFENAENILCNEKKDDFEAFFRLLDRVGKEWHDPDPERSEMEQIKRNFAVLLHFGDEAYDEYSSLLTEANIGYEQL